VLNRSGWTEALEQEEPPVVDILHKIGIRSSSLADAYQALTTREGLSRRVDG
jgi:hypothetical protein